MCCWSWTCADRSSKGTGPANPGLLRTVENPAGSYFFPTEVQGQEQNLFKITYGTQSQFQVKNNSSNHCSGCGNTGCGADPGGGRLQDIGLKQLFREGDPSPGRAGGWGWRWGQGACLGFESKFLFLLY